MSKELTEQWRNGKLPLGKTFWCKNADGNVAKLIHIRGKFFEWTISEQDDTEQVKEVLAKVPTYDQFSQMEKKVEELKRQLEEAEKVIKFYSDAHQLTEEEKQMTGEKYHLVYGLKAYDYLNKHG